MKQSLFYSQFFVMLRDRSIRDIVSSWIGYLYKIDYIHCDNFALT